MALEDSIFYKDFKLKKGKQVSISGNDGSLPRWTIVMIRNADLIFLNTEPTTRKQEKSEKANNNLF